VVRRRHDARQIRQHGFRTFDADRRWSRGGHGVRVFTATSSQGLLYAFELLYTIMGWCVPLVLVNVSRALSSPLPTQAGP
jgi:hypothetical protein